MSDEFEIINEVLDELMEDNTVPKNVRSKIQDTKNALNEDKELSIKVNKALQILDDISDDTNMEPYTRTQVLNIVTLLENLV